MKILRVNSIIRLVFVAIILVASGYASVYFAGEVPITVKGSVIAKDSGDEIVFQVGAKANTNNGEDQSAQESANALTDEPEAEGQVLAANVNMATENELSDNYQKVTAEMDEFYAKLEKNYNYEKTLYEEATKLTNYLRAKKSPIAEYKYARQIISLARANGGDYRIIIAISGIESGFCRANYKKYNCFGYLNGVQYPNYTAALERLVPRITREYANKYGTNFEALAKAYGMLNFTYHAPRMARIYSDLS